MTIKIEYLFNSGYTVETEDKFLVFDYYKGQLVLPENKEVIFFVTHNHYDHFNPEIFKYEEDANYVISFDVDNITERENIKIFHVDMEREVFGIKVRALGSTDQGLSYLVKLDGLTLFHSGDLNWWAWNDSGPEREDEREEEYKSEIRKLFGEKIDLAFVPLDPRLKDRANWASKYFVNQLKPGHYFPMHFDDNFQVTKDFKDTMDPGPTLINPISKRNQVFKIDLKK